MDGLDENEGPFSGALNRDSCAGSFACSSHKEIYFCLRIRGRTRSYISFRVFPRANKLTERARGFNNGRNSGQCDAIGATTKCLYKFESDIRKMLIFSYLRRQDGEEINFLNDPERIGAIDRR